MEKIFELYKEELKIQLGRLICGLTDKIDLKIGYPSLVFQLVSEIVAEEIMHDDFEANGWDYDYDISFCYNKQRYNISGSGYYGNMTICRDE